MSQVIGGHQVLQSRDGGEGAGGPAVDDGHFLLDGICRSPGQGTSIDKASASTAGFSASARQMKGASSSTICACDETGFGSGQAAALHVANLSAP